MGMWDENFKMRAELEQLRVDNEFLLGWLRFMCVLSIILAAALIFKCVVG